MLQRREGNRLRLSGIADPSKARKRIRHIIVAGKFSCLRAGNRAGIPSGFRDVHQRIATGNLAVLSACSCYTTDIISARESTFHKTAANNGAGGTGHTADIVSSGALHTAVAFTVPDGSQVHTARNASRIILFGGNAAPVDTAVHDGDRPELIVEGACPVFCQIIFRIKIELHRQRSHDSGHIHIAQNIPAVHGTADSSGSRFPLLFIGGILKGIGCAAVRRVSRPLLQQIGNDACLTVDGAQIAKQSVG